MKMDFFQKLALSLTLIFLVSSSWAQKDETVATVGNKKITLEEFNKKFAEVRAQAPPNPPTKEQFLEDLIRFEVGVQEAEKKKVSQDPIYQERIKQELYKTLLEKELADKVSKIVVTEGDMESYYKKNPDVRFAHILIITKPGSTPEQRAEAKKRAVENWEEIKKSKRPFEELVKIYSDDIVSKQSGGDVGWQNRVTIVPNLYEAVVSMKTGELKGIVETQFGFHIIKMLGKRGYQDANKRTIRGAVFDEKRKEIFDSYFETVKKGYKIQKNTKLIE